MSSAGTSRLKVNPPLGSPPTLEWRPLDELEIDPVYQRSITAAASQTLIRRIAMFWDWGLCQPLAAARRPDGRLMIVDGQHRLEGARLRRDIAHLPCVITAYADQGDEAAAFVALNQQRRPLSKLDLFKAALAAEDNDATAIARVITESGLMLAGHTNYTVWKPGHLANIGGIEAVWRWHGETIVAPALRALSMAFKGQILRYAGTIFPGIAAMLVEHPAARKGDEFDRFVRVLNARSQADWRREINVQSGLTGERRDRAAKTVMLRDYLSATPMAECAPAPTDMRPSDQAWCAQCDQRVSGSKAAACASPFCSLKVKAA